MKKILLFGMVLMVLVVIVGILYVDQSTVTVSIQEPVVVATSTSNNNLKNATYSIANQPVTLIDGVAEVSAASGSASTITTRYFGNEIAHDLDADGREDAIFILAQNTGGSGTFYYLVAALNTATGYIGSQGLLLGDRIAPQTIAMGMGNIITVQYVDRRPDESFATPPSIGKSISVLLDLQTMQFGEVVADFEGEADPVSMSLTMKPWQWVSTTGSNGSTTTPRRPDAFTVTFASSTFSATTDCNGVGGEYRISGNAIVFDTMMSTMMYCEGSQEGEFSSALSSVESFSFTTKGELILTLSTEAGAMLFK